MEREQERKKKEMQGPKVCEQRALRRVQDVREEVVLQHELLFALISNPVRKNLMFYLCYALQHLFVKFQMDLKA